VVYAANITDLSLDALGQIEVTSASKKVQKRTDVATAIHVITQEDIQRSGVNHIAEALRMAPGVFVARLDSNKWSVSIRGNSGRFSNKLLVLIDGRSVYTPSFSGVFWEALDINIADIDRIEVIRGPGATVWGSNAVNGVINIISKNANDTKGADVSVTAGNLDQTIASARYGFETGDNSAMRIYTKYKNMSDFEDQMGRGQQDNWNTNQAGFRWDWNDKQNKKLTFQGDMYHLNANQVLNVPLLTTPFSTDLSDDIDSSGWNLISKWSHDVSDKTSYNIQVYYTKDKRNEYMVNQVHNIFDAELSLRTRPLDNHDVNIGLGYRNIDDHFDETTIIQAMPVERSNNLYSGYIQDEITLLKDHVYFTVGSKFEHNYFTGMEIQPSARLAILDEHNTMWAAVSKAVRTPSRLEEDGQVLQRVVAPSIALPLKTYIGLSENNNFKSERLWAYELGYRYQIPNFTFDIATFYNNYNDLSSTEIAMPFIQNGIVHQELPFGNQFKGHSYGLEALAETQVLENLKLTWMYSFLDEHLSPKGVTADDSFDVESTSSPKHQISIRSLYQPHQDWDLDFWLRYTANIGNGVGTSATSNAISIPSILAADLRVAYRPNDNLELSMVAKNIFDRRHIEGVQTLFGSPIYIPRSYFLNIHWQMK